MTQAKVSRRTALAAAAVAVTASQGVLAQGAFPNRTISLVVPFPAGGGTDVVGRFIAQHLGEVLPQKVIVVNRGGAGGMVGSQSVKAAPADGYTLMFTSQSIVSQTYDSKGKVSHKDFIFMGMLNQDAIGLAVPQNAKWKTLQDFIADAKKDPGGLSIGTTGPGSVTGMLVPLIEKTAGIKINHIPYPGSAGTHTAALAGTISGASVVVGDAAALIRDGKLRLLGILSGARLEGFPTVPTFREMGLNVDFVFWRGLFIHKDTPPDVVATLRRAIATVARSPAFQNQMKQANYIPAAVVEEAELNAFIRNEETLVEEVLKSLATK